MQARRQETTNHILNSCKVTHTPNTYTWRHNNLMKYITGLIDIDQFLMYAGIPSHTIPGGGTGGKDGYFSAYCPVRNKYQKCQRSKDEQV